MSIVLWKPLWPEANSSLAETDAPRPQPVSLWQEAPSIGSSRPWPASLSTPDESAPYSRSHTPPTRGIEKAPELVDPDKYRPEEVDDLIKVARVVDQKWRKMSALIILGFHTGLRVGNLLSLKWQDIDLEARTASVAGQQGAVGAYRAAH